MRLVSRHPVNQFLTSTRLSLCLSLILFPLSASPQSPEELRGIWMTPRNGAAFWSKAEIAAAMDSVANANFNVVYFNAWSRGWPLWRSEFFHTETGYYTDPAAGERDILQEAVAEAHRRGLEIEPWMEYGFVAWWSGNTLPGYPKGPLLARHPSWHARMYGGSEEFPSGHVGTFYWMSHNNPDVQNFLARLHAEIAWKYDVDGIELDRIRYPGLDCGYDSVSTALYKNMTGLTPPANVADPAWMRWRADRLNGFHRLAYDSIKAANPRVTVSNAPGHYSSTSYYSAYETYLQDWRSWLNSGSVETVQIQMYVRPGTLQQYIPSALNGLTATARPRAYAGIAPKTTGYTLSFSETMNLVHVVRSAGLRGHAFWYYNDLRDLNYFTLLREQAYPAKAAVPFRSPGWRDEGSILDEGTGVRSEGWTPLTLPEGGPGKAWGQTLLYTDATPGRWLEYRFRSPATAWYEAYAYQTSGLVGITSQARYELRVEAGRMDTVVVDQTLSTNAGWVKLGDALLERGADVCVVRLSNSGIEAEKLVAGDAVMLVLNRRKSPDALLAVDGAVRGPALPEEAEVLSSYPNPFNSATNILFRMPQAGVLNVDVYDTLGRHVTRLAEGMRGAGELLLPFRAEGLSSGVYLVRAQSGVLGATRRVVLVQ